MKQWTAITPRAEQIVGRAEAFCRQSTVEPWIEARREASDALLQESLWPLWCRDGRRLPSSCENRGIP